MEKNKMIWEKAIYRPISHNFNPKTDFRSGRLKKPDGLIIHWTGTTESVQIVWSYFNTPVSIRRRTNPRAPASSAHFVVDRDGTATQMIDTEAMAFSVDGAKYDGSRISVEVIATPADPKFRQDQITTCGALLGWLNIKFGTPIKLATNKNESGLSYHGMYSNTSCPGKINIEQNLSKIIEEANKSVQIILPEVYKNPY
jgi:N-acetyl-anhydromuramyl-L-alanine amidase AmpD